MKITSILLLLLLSGVKLSAQLDLTTNLYDLALQGASIYLEKPIAKRTSLEVGLISRVISRNVYKANTLLDFESFKNDGIITRIDYKIYFSKRKLEHQGWYFSLFNRNLFVYNWDDNYKKRWMEEHGSTSEELEYLTNVVQSIKIGWTFGFKRVYKNNIIFFTSFGYGIETILRDPIYFNGDLVAHLGVGYRFNSKTKKKAEK